ncbi:cytochrome P450 [Schizophyllum amplum]|uniref:Cytochrome P450 n=1 Tax=Schizophyllum amplum TaxID=97359 RepID=A0A550CW33_9AGAR|nr:cytochrome P450 [Auriculariopsis ampla]
MDESSLFQPLNAGLLLTGTFAVYVTLKLTKRTALSDLQGPPKTDWLLGNLPDIYHSQVGELDAKWQALYGDVLKYHGAFGEERIWIADPKAAQYIMQTAGYGFGRASSRRQVLANLLGPGILSADGLDHKRQRHVMLPGFGMSEAKAYVPIFSRYASQVSERWKDLIVRSGSDLEVVNVNRWIARATLDAIGEAAFDYHFSSLTEDDNTLANAYNSISQVNSLPNWKAVFDQELNAKLPEFLRNLLNAYWPSKNVAAAQKIRQVAEDVASKLVTEKTSALEEGKSRRDVMSLLLKANATSEQRARMSDEELLAQMHTIIGAGHETTTNTLAWGLYELAGQPELQTRLRAEIRESCGAGDLSSTVLDGMPYLNAVVKEILRFHPVIYHINREATRDEVVPLSKPIVTTTGQTLDRITIPKGTFTLLAPCAYNRNREIFGDDADTFDPERWLTEGKASATHLGVLGNLMTFGGGNRACLGWRFAALEIATFLAELVGEFEFSLTPECERVRREPLATMMPGLDGKTEMPLRVRLAPE